MAGDFLNSDDFSAGGEEEDEGFSLRDIFFVLFRHKDTVMCITGVCFVAALVTSLFFVKRQYTSEAKLMVRIGRESVAVDRTAAPGEQVRTSRSRAEEIGTEMDIINAKMSAEVVVNSKQNLGTYRFNIKNCLGDIVESGKIEINEGLTSFTIPVSGLLSLSK